MQVAYPPGTRVHTDVQAVGRTNLHAHSNAAEIVYVLRGSLRVRVGSENFDLEAGDYAVLNRMDPHLLSGTADNVTAVVYLNLKDFRDVDPFAADMMFACESFDLPRYRKQESLLRGLVLDVIEASATTDARLDVHAADLVRTLCSGYSLADYYQRDRPLTGTQRDRFLSIFAYVQNHPDHRDLLDAVAREHNYSKSYVSHFVKDSAAISFSTAVMAVRVMRAEILLLTSELTMRDISAECGFSDVKYFTRCFVDWFKQTPAEYRATSRAEVARDNEVAPVTADATIALIQEHRRRVASPSDSPRLSITPITLKNIGSRADLFDKIDKFRVDRLTVDAPSPPPESARGTDHLLPMRIGSAELESGFLLSGLSSFASAGVSPCLVLEYAGRDATGALIADLAARLREVNALGLPIWLVYNGLHLRTAIDEIVGTASQAHGLSVQAVLVP